MTCKEKANATYVALQERKRDKARVGRDKDNMGLMLAIESVIRHRGRKDLKYFY